MTRTSMAPGSASAGWISRSLAQVSSACASAKGLPRVPMRRRGVGEEGDGTRRSKSI